MDGRDCVPGWVALPGVSALNSVTNRPRGFDRYPTAPTSTGQGSQSGSVTKRKKETGTEYHDLRNWMDRHTR